MQPSTINFKIQEKFSIVIFCFALLFTSCEKFIDTEPPQNLLSGDKVFTTDQTATSAVVGVYSVMNIPVLNFSCGAITAYTGLYSDELYFTGTTTPTTEFYTNSLSASNATIGSNFWTKAYATIYQINACIEGLTTSETLSAGVKNQLLGESKFLRAFHYFFLINLFGDVPLITNTNYKENSKKGRTSIKEVYNQIISDLMEATVLLQTTYPSTGRVRPNKFSATALLARVYLYQEKWGLANVAASEVINSNLYSLANNLNDVFLAGSNEAIFQMMTTSTNSNTTEGSSFLPGAAITSKPNYAISNDLLNSFEIADNRKTAWIKNKTVSGQQYFYPYKYKVPTVASGFVLTENYMMLRYAEMYLIRAEASIQGGNISGGVADLNVIRKRARPAATIAIPNPLPDLSSSLLQGDALLAVERERRIEFFTEWGHRWFDLKRTNRVDVILEPLKTGWESTDVLFPIPKTELLLNPSLTQNQGY